MLAYIFIPIIQRELDNFRFIVWNHRRGRKQDGKVLPTGIPDIHNNPEEYEAGDCGTVITDDELVSVGLEYSIDLEKKFIDEELFQQFAQVVPNVEEIESSDAVNQFIYLKENYPEN